MSDPRYVPRNFLIEPRNFGRSPFPQWHRVEGDWAMEKRAQLDASISQHQVTYGVREIYMQKPRTTKITDLAVQLDVEYYRLQKMFSGQIIMQMVDLARLRLLVGPRLDYWMMRGENAEYIRAQERELQRRRSGRAPGRSAL